MSRLHVPRSLSAPLSLGLSIALVGASLTTVAIRDVASAPQAQATERISQQSGFNARAWTVTPPDASGNRYVGGDFTSYKAWNTGVGGVVDAATAAVDPSFASVSAWPYADVVVSDGAGGWFIGGGINNVGGTGVTRVAHLNADGSLDTSWTPSVSGGQGVWAMARVGNTLFIGGDFSSVNGQTRTRLAALDATTGTLLSWAPVANSTVHTMTAHGDSLYVGGQFTQLAGQSRGLAGEIRLGARTGGVGGTCLDAWDDTDCLTGWNPSVGGWGVKSIVTDGTHVWLGGAISSVGGQARGGVGKVAADNVGAVDPWNPNLNSEGESLALDGTTLYVGGLFTTASGQTRNNLAAYDTTTGALTSWDPNVSGNTVKSIAVEGSTVYVGGRFTGVGGQSRFHAAAIGTDGVVQAWDPHVCNQGNGAQSYVYGLAVAAGSVYLIGDFPCLGGLKRTHAAAVGPDGILTSWAPVINGPVYSFSRLGSTIYMAGNFSSVNFTPRTTAAAVDASGVLTAWNPGPAGDRATDVLATPTKIYMSGFFNSIGGAPARGVAVVDPVNGTLDPNFDPQLDGPVRAMWLDGTRLFVGGDFSSAGGEAHVHIASLNAETGAVNSAFVAGVSDGFNTGAQIEALTVIGERVYLGGYFQKVNTVGQRFAAAVDATTGALDVGWSPTISNWVFALMPSADRSTIFIGGDGGMSVTSGADSAQGIAEVDAVTGQLTTWRANTGEVRGISVSDAAVFLAGSFGSVGGQDRRNSAAVDVDGNVLDPWPMDPATSVPLVVAVAGTAPGAVVSAPGGINCGASCTYAYSAGSTVTLTAVPAAGAFFDNWSGACTGSGATCTVTMAASRSATAEFVSNAPNPNPNPNPNPAPNPAPNPVPVPFPVPAPVPAPTPTPEPVDEAPGAPTQVTVHRTTTSATVSWSVPESTGSAPILGYRVVATPGGATCTTEGETSCTVEGLEPGVTYTFTVTARNSVDWGSPGDPVEVDAMTISITAGPRVSQGRTDRISLTGTVTGLAPGTVLTPYLKVGKGRTERLKRARIVVNDSGEITWRRLVKSHWAVKVTLRAEGVASNSLTWKRIR